MTDGVHHQLVLCVLWSLPELFTAVLVELLEFTLCVQYVLMLGIEAPKNEGGGGIVHIACDW